MDIGLHLHKRVSPTHPLLADPSPLAKTRMGLGAHVWDVVVESAGDWGLGPLVR